MKKIISILVVSLVLFSCSKDDKPATNKKVKVIDQVSVQYLNTVTLPENYITKYEYTSNAEISKISLFRNGAFQASFDYEYQNSVPVSAQYYNPENDEDYPLNYNYSNAIFSSISYPTYNTTETFTYNETLNEYAGSGGNLQFRLNNENDIFQKTVSGTTLNYSFESNKKGPFFNVVNKKWIPTLWFISRLEANLTNVTTSFPVTSVTDSNASIIYTYNNTYDTDGFVTKSVYSNTIGTTSIEINFTYKKI
jgi:hypothetical protein